MPPSVFSFGSIFCFFDTLDFVNWPWVKSCHPDATFESYIWDVENPARPELTLKPPSMAVCVEYNPKDPNQILSGLQSGQVCIWDTRTGGIPTRFSPPDKSHRDPVHRALWIQSKTGTDFFSTSTDGIVKWWDTRKIGEPVEELILDITKKVVFIFFLTESIFSRKMPNWPLAQYLLSSSQLCRQSSWSVLNGAILFPEIERQRQMPTKLQQSLGSNTFLNCYWQNPSGHLGPVYNIRRNPSFPKIFLTVGDWTARVWSEDIKDANILGTQVILFYPNSQLNLSLAWSSIFDRRRVVTDQTGRFLHFENWRYARCLWSDGSTFCANTACSSSRLSTLCVRYKSLPL